jgi:hypothetical protein
LRNEVGRSYIIDTIVARSPFVAALKFWLSRYLLGSIIGLWDMP